MLREYKAPKKSWFARAIAFVASLLGLRGKVETDPQVIVFKLMLETDPRYREQLRKAKADVIATQTKISHHPAS
jgi:hypothetical protein